MNFVFLSPDFPRNNQFLCRCLKLNGATVLGIGNTEYDSLSDDLRLSLTEYYRVSDMRDYAQLVRAMGYFTFKYGKLDWLESNNAAMLPLDADLRTDFNITTGMKSGEYRTVTSRFRILEALQQAGVPALRHCMLVSQPEAEEFSERMGYPVLIKSDVNRIGASCYRITSRTQMSDFYELALPGPYVLLESVQGNYFVLDGLVNSRGEIMWHSLLSHLNPLFDVINEEAPVCFRAEDTPPELLELAKKVLDTLNIRRTLFHIAFVQLVQPRPEVGQRGDFIVLELHCHPCASPSLDMINYTRSMDAYQFTADMVVFDGPRHDYPGPCSHSAYLGRWDGRDYLHSDENVRRKYKGQIRQYALSEAENGYQLGNRYFIACFDNADALDEFSQYTLAQ